jgi:hypothetical protein
MNAENDLKKLTRSQAQRARQQAQHEPAHYYNQLPAHLLPTHLSHAERLRLAHDSHAAHLERLAERAQRYARITRNLLADRQANHARAPLHRQGATRYLLDDATTQAHAARQAADHLTAQATAARHNAALLTSTEDLT